jgi:hypothetical protein
MIPEEAFEFGECGWESSQSRRILQVSWDDMKDGCSTEILA